MAKAQKEKTAVPVPAPTPQELKKASRRKMRANQKARAAKGEPKPKRTRPKKIGKAVFGKDVVPKVGRPPLLTVETAIKICEHLRKGLFIQSALYAEGINRNTYYAWKDQGERDIELGYTDSVPAQFLDMIKKAEVEVETTNLDLLQKGGFGWQANAWFLERRFPARWGNRMRLSLEEAQDFARKLMGVLVEEVPDRAVLARIVAKVQKIQGESRELVTTGSGPQH